MEKAFKFLIAGLAVGLILAAAGTFAITSAMQPQQLDCKECHEGHGSVVAPDVNANGTITLTGDFPQDEYVSIPDIFTMPQIEVLTLKSQNDEGIPSKGVPVLNFLKAHGVTGFDQLILYADDFELTVNRSDITDETVFVPCEYSIRMLGSNMPVTAWAKNVKTIVVVGGNAGDSITLNGKEVSYGQMLDNGISSMKNNPKFPSYLYNDTSYQFETGFMVSGIGLKDLLFKEGYADFSNVTIKGTAEKTLSRDDVLKGSYFVTRDQGKIKIATAEKTRANWMDVESITVS
jgi:hypothetical protein